MKIDEPSKQYDYSIVRYEGADAGTYGILRAARDDLDDRTVLDPKTEDEIALKDCASEYEEITMSVATWDDAVAGIAELVALAAGGLGR